MQVFCAVGVDSSFARGWVLSTVIAGIDRGHKGKFKSVDELTSVPEYENKELRFRAVLRKGDA